MLTVFHQPGGNYWYDDEANSGKNMPVLEKGAEAMYGGYVTCVN
jgi:hypothetical protein